MQNYITYIIGILVIAVLGVFIYSIMKPSQPVQDNFNNQQVATTSDESMASTSNEVATTTGTTTAPTNTKMKAMYKVKMETTKGTIELELDTNIAPNTVANFIKLTDQGFYNGTRFHRVIPGFMIQGGDPLSKDDSKQQYWGTGGPGYKFADEISNPEVYKNGYKRGILAMANSGPDTNGSQFFIMHKDTPLPPNYTIFGKVISGLDTVDAIASVKTLYPGQLDRPAEPITITKVTLEQ